MKVISSLKRLQESLSPLRTQVAQHEVYRAIGTIEELQIFMEHHVYAVWDFMSLLKALQRDLTCIELPWIPQGNPLSRRWINEIVLEEETDAMNEGGYLSHFELYRAAMEQCGADISKIDGFLQAVTCGWDVGHSLAEADVPVAAQAFVRTTMTTVRSGAAHRIAAAFTLGREDVIPVMFKALVAKLRNVSSGELTLFHDYLDRHIKLDEERHTPMALQMLAELCGDNCDKWRQAEATARTALKARITLWDGVADRIAIARKQSDKWPFILPTATGLAGGRRAVSLSKTSAGV
jgi:hypothetical protein